METAHEATSSHAWLWTIAAALIALLVVVAALLWRVETDAVRSEALLQRQPAEALVHARRVATMTFAWQPSFLAAKNLLVEEVARAPESLYSRRALRDMQRARRSWASPWKVAGLLGFCAFVTGIIAAIHTEGRRRAVLAGGVGVGFILFSVAMTLI